MSRVLTHGAKVGAAIGHLTADNSITSSEKVKYITEGLSWGGAAYLLAFILSVFVGLVSATLWPISIVFLIGVGWIINMLIQEAREERVYKQRIESASIVMEEKSRAESTSI